MPVDQNAVNFHPPFLVQVKRLRDLLRQADDRAVLVRDAKDVLSQGTENVLRREITELASKLADTDRVSAQVQYGICFVWTASCWSGLDRTNVHSLLASFHGITTSRV